MRRMFSEKQIKGIVQESSSEVVEALKGQDISVEGITSKGIANTGGLANIGNVAISGELSASGDVKVFENIVDAEGHKRFIEGEISINEDLPSGITKTYGKWSLSGTHLMLVLVLSFPNGTELPSGNYVLARTSILPQWILDKITPSISTSTIEITTVGAFDSTSNYQDLSNVSLLKSSDKLLIQKYGTLTFTSDKKARFVFDLLIDNE